MAYFVVKSVVWLLGGIASIFRGEEYCVVVIKNTWHNFVLNVVVWL